MRPRTVTVAAVDTSVWIPVDWRANEFNVSIAVITTGTITYTVEHTFDDVFDPNVTPTAFPHGVLAAQTADGDDTYDHPITAVRLNNTAGTGSTTMTIIHGG